MMLLIFCTIGYAVQKKSSGINAANQEENKTVIQMVMINDTLYQGTGRESQIDGRCGVMDGEITSTVKSSEIPSKNNQSNFGLGYGYQYASDDTIDIYMDAHWMVFQANSNHTKE